MAALFAAGPFAGFGPSQFSHDASPPAASVTATASRSLGDAVRADAPKRPGVYGMLGRRGELVYVGKAKSLRARLMSYFRENSRDDKAGRIIDHTRRLVWEESPSEFAALLRELELIRKFLPRFNVQGKPGRVRHSYVCVGREPAPYVYVTNRPTGKELAAFGPLVGQKHLSDAARRLNDMFGLRDCSQRQPLHFADQLELFESERTPGCLRFDIGTCCGPCVAAVTRAGYRVRAREAADFLAGSDLKPLAAIDAEMAKAASLMEFERAAALRDKADDIKRLIGQLAWLRKARAEYSYVYRLPGAGGHTLWYLIRRGRVRHVAPEPVNGEQRDALRATVEHVFGADDPAEATVCPSQIDSILLVAGWFRRHPGESDRLLTRRQALAALKPVPNAA